MQQHVRNCVLYDRETSYRSLPTILRIAVQCPVLTVLHEHWTNNQPRKEADGNLHPIPSSSSQTRTLNLLHPLIIITHLTPPHLHTSTKQKTVIHNAAHRRQHHHQTPQPASRRSLRRCGEYDIKPKSRGGAHLKPSEASPTHIVCTTVLSSAATNCIVIHSLNDTQFRTARISPPQKNTEHALHATTSLQPASYSQIRPRGTFDG